MAAPRIPGLLIGALLIAGVALAAQSARGAESGSTTAVVRGSFYRLEGGVPPGFEQLTAPQRALVDVYSRQPPVRRSRRDRRRAPREHRSRGAPAGARRRAAGERGPALPLHRR